MVSVEKIERGLASYLDKELMPQLPAEGAKRILAGTAVSIIIKRSGSMIEQLKENKILLALGIVDEVGNVDLELLKDEIKNQMTDSGLRLEIPFIGAITFKREDVDLLYRSIINA